MRLNLPIRTSTLREHLWGPTGSVLLHILLVLALLHWVRGRKPEEPKDLIFASLATPVPDLPDWKPMEPRNEEEGTPEPNKGKIQDDPVDPPSGLNPPAVPTDAPKMIPATLLTDPERLALPKGLQSLLPQELTGRLERNARPNAEDHSLAKALAWLRDHQNTDGSWGRSHPYGYTGLALLTFLAHGETPASEAFGTTMEKGLMFLLDRQQANGRFPAAAGHAFVYEHAIATYALAETFGLTRIPRARGACERAAAVILAGQNAAEVWGYDYDPATTRGDTSVTAWQVQALKALSISGLKIPGVEEALPRSLAGLNSLHRAQENGYAYTSQDRRTSPGLNAAGVLCYQLNGAAGQGNPARVLRGVMEAEPALAATSGWPYYSVYYQAQAVFHGDPARFAHWSKRWLTDLARAQHADGSWKSGSVSEGGEDDLTRRVHATALAALSLQVRTRTHLGTGKPVDAVASRRFEPGEDLEIDLRL